jgi:hypothetical protein
VKKRAYGRFEEASQQLADSPNDNQKKRVIVSTKADTESSIAASPFQGSLLRRSGAELWRFRKIIRALIFLLGGKQS